MTFSKAFEWRYFMFSWRSTFLIARGVPFFQQIQKNRLDIFQAIDI